MPLTLNSSGPLGTENCFGFGGNTQNRFLPLRDLEGPIEEFVDGDGTPYPSRGREGPGLPQYQGNDRGTTYGGPGSFGQDTQQWGFQRPSQGTKRAADQGEEPEGGDEYELKRKKL